MIFQLFWASLAQIWGLLSCFGFRVRFFVDFQRCSAKLGSKMEQNGPSWDQVGSKLRPRVAKMLPRWPTWSLFRCLWEDTWSMLVDFWSRVRGEVGSSAKYENEQHSITSA